MRDGNKPRRPPRASQRNLSGEVVRARVTKLFLDHCELDLLSNEDGSVLGKGRLYQSESAAWKDARLLASISSYSLNTVLDAVFVNNQRIEDGLSLWYVHERWGSNNPWTNLVVAEDDIVVGTIARRIASAGQAEPVGYVVQLDLDTPIQSRHSAGTKTPERGQPDIEVFLPREEVPWVDGTLGSIPTRASANRFALEIGDRVQTLILKIDYPPRNPRVSINRLINYLDTTCEREFEHRDTLALWRFRRLLGSTHPVATNNAASATLPLHDKPYEGKRLLLVDDDASSLASQAELLQLMGAEVSCIEVKTNRFGQAISEVSAALREGGLDLVLIDNNLPGRGLGLAMIEKVHAQLGTNLPSVRLVLLTANAVVPTTAETPDLLRAKGVAGMVQRPMSHRALQQLLAGEEIWETGVRSDGNSPVQSQANAAGTFTVQEVVDAIAFQKGVSFVVLVKARRNVEAEDMITAGNAPFARHEYSEALSKTDLRLLVEGRIAERTILGHEAGNEFMRAGGRGPAYWATLDLGNARWVFGIGHAPDGDIQDRLPLWREALAVTVEVQGWRDWGRHVSSFVQLGLAHQGLSHEVFNLQDEFGHSLSNLRRWLARLELGATLDQEVRNHLNENVVKLVKVSDDLLDFSKRQLREHALRHQKVFLPDAVAAIRRIASSECLEAEVAMRVASAPSLALPLPNAALVLPAVNLLINAAKHHYRRENRRVELLFDLEESGDRRTLLVDVRDNGPGLDRTTLDRLWQPGFSTAGDANRRHGIGLWLARQLVAEAGGSLTLQENWRFVGTWFRLRLPIHLG